MNTRDLAGKTVWHWQFYYSRNGRQILAASKVGTIGTIHHFVRSQTIDVGGLSIPDDLEYSVKKDRIEIDLGDAYVVLRLREAP